MDRAGAVQRLTLEFQEPAPSQLGVRMLGVLLWRCGNVYAGPVMLQMPFAQQPHCWRHAHCHTTCH